MQQFIDHSRQLLLQDYLPKIEHCVSLLPERAIWWRPNANTNAVGNLLLHLSGNLLQWIIHGIGGTLCVRRRAVQFSATGDTDRAGLVHELRKTCTEAGAVLSALDSARLTERCKIQGVEVTVMGAIYHAVEHFSGHLGQIIYVTKMHAGRDLRFWVIGEDGAVQRGWTAL